MSGHSADFCKHPEIATVSEESPQNSDSMSSNWIEQRKRFAMKATF